ncbi:MAG: FAD/NAD(P)-binding protein [Anaerolineae bacterium]|jgi:hypothetical protein|nr:FAD/NAD(P)-binding protein [Anaerolineae bacterium]
MLEWLIIGGGIHGTHLSLVLTQRMKVPADRIRVLDPYPLPLTRWHQVTHNTGMRYLRSPLVHHLHHDQGALGVFARIHQHQPYTEFIPTYSRPSLELFNRHSQHLIEKYRLIDLRIPGRASGLQALSEGWRVETENGGIESKRVLLAISLSEQPHIPTWAQPFPHIQHIFDPNFQREAVLPNERIAIIGGGITAAQTALTLAQASHHSVTLITRHSSRIFDFDSDPCWMNALCLGDFHQIPDYIQRRKIIRSVRHRGSMPYDVAHDLQQAIHEGRVRRVEGEIGDQIDQYDRVLLATGWEQTRPGGVWLDQAIEAYGLPIAPCGFPIVARDLCWQTGLYVTGALAELEIGPAARNIIGARMAGERLRSA